MFELKLIIGADTVAESREKFFEKRESGRNGAVPRGNRSVFAAQ